MPTPNFAVMAKWMEQDILAARDRLNTDSTFRLFKNKVTITPNKTAADFTECNWTNYEAVNLFGKWKSPVQESEGVWRVTSEGFEILTPPPGQSQEAEGVYLTETGGVIGALYLPVPLVAIGGNPSFKFAVTLRLGARGWFPEELQEP